MKLISRLLRSRLVRSNCGLIAIAVPLLQFALASSAVAEDWHFGVKFAEKVHQAPFSGRVYIFFSRNRPEPRQDPDWFFPEPFIARDVKDVKPGDVVEFSSGDKSVLA